MLLPILRLLIDVTFSTPTPVFVNSRDLGRMIFSMRHWLYIALGVILGTTVLYWVSEFISPRTTFWR